MTARRLRTRVSGPHLYKPLGEQYVLFDAASGDTHVFDSVVRDALICLSAEPQTPVELLAAMAAHLDVPADETLERYLSQLLARLDDLGLVEWIDA
jgi:PqqD family protein of HPr-rel-A system